MEEGAAPQPWQCLQKRRSKCGAVSLAAPPTPSSARLVLQPPRSFQGRPGHLCQQHFCGAQGAWEGRFEAVQGAARGGRRRKDTPVGADTHRCLAGPPSS